MSEYAKAIRRAATATYDEIYQPMYDTCAFQNTPDLIRFFQRPMGTPGGDLQPLGPEDTSQYLAGVLPLPNQFYLTGLGVYYVPDYLGDAGTSRAMNITDTLAILGQGCLRLQIQNRRYLEVSPLAMVTPNFPMYWAREDSRLEKLLGEGEISGELAPKVRNRPFDIVPILIAPNQHYAVEVSFKQRRRLHSVGKLGVILYGRLIREAT